ncbi:MAG TPA: hypothetical protein IAA98_10510 [Candidatus Avipropionibacterium avicola]|uniref:PIN domain-containing protein n=1 Tax=Candidatus Avipropionibacterium avicola TaxID=2840701 RepID=A0A9D1KNP2_9ACTN|nr:hypothetical protein [Candidatus Avipropionibacterium avicola]
MSEAPLLFLDANALASLITRTLLIAGARADGLRWTWSRHVEAEADRHARGRASRTSIVRQEILGTELSPTAPHTEGLVTSTPEDRQVLADAIRAGARHLITTDADSFAFDDLLAHGLSAVNPEYFMASRFTERAYVEGVDLLAAVQKSPSRTASEIHRMLGLRHPRLTGQFAGAYDTAPAQADPDQPSTIFRGVVCIRCEALLGHLVRVECHARIDVLGVAGAC